APPTSAGQAQRPRYAIAGGVTKNEYLKVKATDQTVTSSTTVVDDADLQFPVGVSETWVVALSLYLTSSAAGGMRLNVSLPAAASGTYRIPAGPSSSVPSTTAFDVYPGTLGADIQLDTSASSTDHVVNLSVTVTTGATAGTAKLQFAQRVSDATA